MTELDRESGSSQVWQTHRQVGVEVEDRRPGEEVLLTFLAPKLVLSRFLAGLRQEDLEVAEEPLVPGLAILCRCRDALLWVMSKTLMISVTLSSP